MSKVEHLCLEEKTILWFWNLLVSKPRILKRLWEWLRFGPKIEEFHQTLWDILVVFLGLYWWLKYARSFQIISLQSYSMNSFWFSQYGTGKCQSESLHFQQEQVHNKKTAKSWCQLSLQHQNTIRLKEWTQLHIRLFLKKYSELIS